MEANRTPGVRFPHRVPFVVVVTASIMHNIYYNPKECGLEIIDTLDESGLSYEFNTLIVVRATDTNRMYWAHSSGCSCPTPFEEYSYASAENHNLNEIRRETLDQFINAVNDFPVSVDERQAAIQKVRNGLRRKIL